MGFLKIFFFFFRSPNLDLYFLNESWYLFLFLEYSTFLGVYFQLLFRKLDLGVLQFIEGAIGAGQQCNWYEWLEDVSNDEDIVDKFWNWVGVVSRLGTSAEQSVSETAFDIWEGPGEVNNCFRTLELSMSPKTVQAEMGAGSFIKLEFWKARNCIMTNLCFVEMFMKHQSSKCSW